VHEPDGLTINSASLLLKGAYKALGQLTGFAAIAGIKSRLPATGLPLVELHFAANAAKHFNGADTDCAPKLIDKTGDE